jgi:hypothetical protein
MKTKLFFASLLIGFYVSAQTPTCFNTPDGTDGNGWGYKDFVIPTGYKIDSVLMTATRPGYPANQDAMVMWYCPSSSSYTNCTGGKTTLNYNNFTTSMYNTWLRVDTANNNAPGMVRITLPTNAGAIWSQLCIATSLINTSNCYATPDGTDGNGWSYKDFIIPAGYKIDSVLMTATRPSYPANQDAMVMWYCPSSNSYTNCTGGKTTLNYNNFTTSMYNTWLRVDTANNNDPGMVRVTLPTNAGAIWSQLCLATSIKNTTSIQSVSFKNENISIYPNPTNQYLYLKNIKGSVNIDVTDVTGQIVKSIQNPSNTIDVSDLEKGFYFIRIEGETNNQLLKFIIE